MKITLTVLIAMLIYGVAVGLRSLSVPTWFILLSEIAIGAVLFFILKFLKVISPPKETPKKLF